jgi:hypothetical protein
VLYPREIEKHSVALVHQTLYTIGNVGRNSITLASYLIKVGRTKVLASRILDLDLFKRYLGGLSCSLAVWMVKHEALCLLFLSRTRIASPETSIIIQELKSIGAAPEVVQW